MHDPIIEFGQRLVQVFAYLVRIIVQNKNTDNPQMAKLPIIVKEYLEQHYLSKMPPPKFKSKSK